jgi:hypothetical protein
VLLAVPAGVPAEWVEGVARMLASPPPDGVSQKFWRNTGSRVWCFLGLWGAKAFHCGWTATDIFGSHPMAPETRLDSMGLAVLIEANDIIGIDATAAQIAPPSGALLTYRKRPMPEAVPVFELANIQCTHGEEVR